MVKNVIFKLHNHYHTKEKENFESFSVVSIEYSNIEDVDSRLLNFDSLDDVGSA